MLEASVLAAKPNREIAIGAEELAENCYVAYFDRIFGKKDPVFAEYRLPAMALPPPLQVLCARPCCANALQCEADTSVQEENSFVSF